MNAETITLPPRIWFKLKELANRATKLHKTGGWQDRLRAWRDQMDEAGHTIRLSRESGGPRRLDDFTFIVHAIEQAHKGTWQKQAFEIFAGTHPEFTGLNIKPREIRR